jgi:hypothetical protein
MYHKTLLVVGIGTPEELSRMGEITNPITSTYTEGYLSRLCINMERSGQPGQRKRIY